MVEGAEKEDGKSASSTEVNENTNSLSTSQEKLSAVEATDNATDSEKIVNEDNKDAILPQEKEGHLQTSQNAGLEPSSELSKVSTKQFSVFTTKEKKLIIVAGSLAGFFSPLSSTIYFPALNTIAAALHVSNSDINLTVTTFVILQGIAPMMIAGFSDNVGRRPAYILCFLIYILANLGLGLQNSYAALLVLRCFQSSGSSGTIALSNGLVGDMVTSEERGSYIAFASLGGLLGPAIAPIIGGAISQNADWHWIFWFLLIFAGVFFVPLFLFLPETCRKVVDDGSIPPPKWAWSLTDVLRHKKRRNQGIEIDAAKQAEFRKNVRFRLPNPLPTLRIITDPESFLILVATGLALACFYAISTGAAASLGQVYGFNDIQIALMFIPFSVGGIVSALTTGKIVDWNYRRYAAKQGITIAKGVRQDLSNFPIERARMEVAVPLSLFYAASVVGYGWTMDHKISLAGPVILMFLTGYAGIATYQVYNILMVDIWPGQSAAASAANNFIRCELGAAATAAINPLSNAIGRGWAYTTLALIQLAFTPLLFLIMRRGIRMRKAKAERDARKRKQKENKLEQNS